MRLVTEPVPKASVSGNHEKDKKRKLNKKVEE